MSAGIMAPKGLPSRSVPASVLGMMAPRVAQKKKPAPEAAVAEGAVTMREFTVSLDMSTGKVLGVDADWSDGKTGYVKSVFPGVVNDWNKQCTDKQQAIRPGDRIIAANGFSGDAATLLKLVKAPQRCLELLIRAPRAAPEGGAEDSPEQAAKKAKDAELYSWLPAADPEKDRDGGERAKGADLFAGDPAPPDPTMAIFLDIDGVLRRIEDINVDGEVLPLNARSRAFAPDAMKALRLIVHRTGASVVLSSEWRRNHMLKEEVATAFRAVGLPPLRGVTPVVEAREEVLVGSPAIPDMPATMTLRWADRRAREITLWLREHLEVKRWVTLDDLDLGKADEVKLPDTLWMAKGLVLTDREVGLTLSDARKAFELLTDGKTRASARSGGGEQRGSEGAAAGGGADAKRRKVETTKS